MQKKLALKIDHILKISGITISQVAADGENKPPFLYNYSPLAFSKALGESS